MKEETQKIENLGNLVFEMLISGQPGYPVTADFDHNGVWFEVWHDGEIVRRVRITYENGSLVSVREGDNG